MGYTPPDAIDVGTAAVNRASSFGNTNRTFVNRQNPANSSGKIKSIEIWANISMTLVEVATFFVVSGNILSTRDNEAIGNVTAGSKQTFTVDLDVEAGDYIGMYWSAGDLEEDAGGAQLWHIDGDSIPCESVIFTLSGSNYTDSLYGTGESGAGELTIGEAFSAVDSLVKNGTEQLAEAFSAIDSWVAKISFDEVISIVESVGKTASHALAEAFSAIDSWVAKISFDEVISIVESVGKTASHALAEAVDMADTKVTKVFFALAEVIDVVDTKVTFVVFSFFEAVGLADAFRKSINWVQEIINTIEYTEELKNTITWEEEEKSDDDMWTKETKI